MPLLEVSEVTKSFGTARAVDNVSLTAERGELVCLLGPSGCGKTTLLRLIAGLVEPDLGSITFGGRVLDGLPPRDRGFGLMFQDLALFPHMDVSGNVSFGLRMQKLETKDIEHRVDALLELVDLSGFGHRKVHQLSGGERQRVALARSLAPEPKLLMLDEPLGSLDRGLRESLQTEVRAILKEVGVTAIYVTHDRDEAFAMADSIVVMDRGKVVQAGPPEELFTAPASELVARSLGLRNVMRGTVITKGAETMIESPLGTLVPCNGGRVRVQEGGEVLVLIDERQISVHRSADAESLDGTVLDGRVESRRFHGGESEFSVLVGEGRLICMAPLDGASGGLEAGDGVCVVVPSQAVRLVPRDA
ncbi:MAG: ABC transporter ATP-binding protein [Chloroflexi bacterium]|nr:ABC transporter ATP-binding protein [Chloroflexota bacterium]